MKPVLVDTSVWRRYFGGARSVRRLADLLDEYGAVLMHPFIIGEMVLGGLSAREEAMFARLPIADTVPHQEVLSLVRQRRLTRHGIGWVDAHLLASALASSAALWSVDADLSSAAAELGVDFGAAPT
jgi:predicted nucleic acid-binding protein